MDMDAETGSASTRQELLLMGMMDNIAGKAKDLASQNKDKVDQGLDLAGDKINEATGDKYADHVEKGKDMINQQIDEPNA